MPKSVINNVSGKRKEYTKKHSLHFDDESFDDIEIEAKKGKKLNKKTLKKHRNGIDAYADN